MLITNSKVLHASLGEGQVVSDLGSTVVVRFTNKIEICEKKLLQTIPDIFDYLNEGKLHSSLETIARLQALTIRSINDKWGVFGRSQIDLLPHQLWVCRQAKNKSPCRLLVADDVGLGKTIEAGIIISSFLSQGKVNRLLIMTPSSLVEQWQYRMRTMFDIRLTAYSTERDTEKSGFWECHDNVVASYHTLRFDNNHRQDRLFQSKPWDLVIVDEAHHFNKDIKLGATLGYQLLQKMLEQNLINDLILFTGTPHRGKNFNFLSLMSLLTPQFDPDKELFNQLPLLHDFMIRNNKYNVTDINGKKLFTEPEVTSTTYQYSEAEQIFYDMLTEFISNGFAYANGQSLSTCNIVVLVLITMQKLASSSVAAIRQAIRRRLQKQIDGSSEIVKLEAVIKKLQEDMEDDSMTDQIASLEAELIEKSDYISLIENERPALEKLLSQADMIVSETKINTFLEIIESDYHNEQLLFFTEYKATQKLLLESLLKKYGENSATFINGDEQLNDVVLPNGTTKRIKIQREHAAESFNMGKHRFLIATEAAGEGIDLQENCHILFHIDLPWNPMRLHQRVGRLNRYGQKEKVIVRSLRNPATVESRIWNKLNEKLSAINLVFGAVMEEKEDIIQLVLGMTPPKLLNDLFAYAPRDATDEKLSDWFNKQTATFGGEDVFKAVKDIAGNASKFNYNNVSKHLPKVDLPELMPFWKNILSINHKRLNIDGEKLSFLTPESWIKFGINNKYDNLVLCRHRKHDENIMGIGFKVFDAGLEHACKIISNITICEDIDNLILTLSVRDHLTDHSGEKQSSFYGCIVSANSEIIEVLPDWKLLQQLNLLKVNILPDANCHKFDKLTILLKNVLIPAETAIKKLLAEEDFRPVEPIFTVESVIIPSNISLL